MSSKAINDLKKSIIALIRVMTLNYLDFSGEVEVSGLDQFLIKPLQSEKGRDKKFHGKWVLIFQRYHYTVSLMYSVGDSV